MWSHKRLMLWRFSAYGFLKNLKFFEPFLYLFFWANGLNFFQIGLLIGLREALTFILEIPTGVIADISGRRKAMSIAFGSYITSFVIFYYFSSFGIFAFAMVFFAMGETFRSGTHKAMIMQHLDNENIPEMKVEYYGLTRSASRLGSALSALLAGMIVYYFQSYNIIFLVTIVPYSMAFVLMLTYPKELDGTPCGASVTNAWNHTKNSFRQLIKYPDLSRMLVNASIYDSFFKISKDYLAPVAETLAITLPLLLFIEVPEQRTAILVGVVYFFVYINSFFSSRKSVSLMKRVGDMSRALNLLYFFMASTFIAIALFLFIDIVWLSVASFFFIFTLYNLRKPMVVGFLGDVIEPQSRATLLSGENQLRSVTGIVIAPILGFLADTQGISIAFLFGALVLFTVAVILPIKDTSRMGQRYNTA